MHTVKPRIMVAILPNFARNVFYSLPIVLALFGLYFLLKKPFGMSYPLGVVILMMMLLLLVIATLPLIATIFTMNFTRYYFFRTHMVKEINIITVRKQSVPYHQIVNITTHISPWGRVWDTGDVVIHTVEETIPDIILAYVKDPNRIESSIYHMVHQSKGGHK